jgi:hypothetical protein
VTGALSQRFSVARDRVFALALWRRRATLRLTGSHEITQHPRQAVVFEARVGECV